MMHSCLIELSPYGDQIAFLYLVSLSDKDLSNMLSYRPHLRVNQHACSLSDHTSAFLPPLTPISNPTAVIHPSISPLTIQSSMPSIIDQSRSTSPVNTLQPATSRHRTVPDLGPERLGLAALAIHNRSHGDLALQLKS